MQNGMIVRRGNWWFLRYYVSINSERRQKAVKLVRFDSREYPTADSVRNAGHAGKYLAAINTNTAPPEEDVLLSAYIEHRFLPHVSAHLKPSTLKNYCDRFKILEPHLKDFTLKNTDTPQIQRAFDAIASDKLRAKTALRHIKALLSGVFRRAILDGKVKINPVTASVVPEGKRTQKRRHYSLTEIWSILDALDEPAYETARTVCVVAALTGLRIGEIAALKWEDIHDNELHVQRAVWRGHLGDVKTESSEAPLPLLPVVKKALEAHHKRSAGEFVFQGEKSGKPLVMENLLDRKIKPALKRVNLPWKGWHGFRRGLGTNLHALGVDMLTISRLLRHSSTAITEQAYVQPVSEDSKKALAKLEKAFRRSK